HGDPAAGQRPAVAAERAGSPESASTGRRGQVVMFRRTKLFILIGALGATAALGSSPLGAAGAPSAMLRAIASKVDDRMGTITIEASEPVPYVASQPDARTFVVELRDVDMAGFSDR